MLGYNPESIAFGFKMFVILVKIAKLSIAGFTPK